MLDRPRPRLVPETTWKARYGLINSFEALLAHGGTTVIKLFLHISKEEQRKRFDARLAEPSKRWKFQPGDLAEREHWDEYQVAYADALTANTTDRRRTVVRDPGRPQVVPQLGGEPDPDRHVARASIRTIPSRRV